LQPDYRRRKGHDERRAPPFPLTIFGPYASLQHHAERDALKEMRDAF